MIINPYISFPPVSGYDADAQAYFDANTGLTTTQKDSWATLLAVIKSISGLWAATKFVYPFLGSTAAAHKWNAKDPRDLDAAFRIVFNGTITHNANGPDWNGSSGYGNTKMVPSTNGITSTVGFMGYYGIENLAAAARTEMGCASSNSHQMNLCLKYTGDRFAPIQTDGSAFPTVANTDSRGWYVVQRTTTNTEGYKNNSRVVNQAQTGGNINTECYLGAINGVGTPLEFSGNQCAFAMAAAITLSTTDHATLYNAIQAFQTTNARQV